MNQEIKCTVYRNATVVPFRKNTYGVYTHEKQPVAEAMLFRNYGRIFSLAPYEEAGTRLQGDIIFTGFLFKHYGHFLLESLSRLWFAKLRPEMPVLWVGRDTMLLGFQSEILGMLGLTNRIYVADQAVCCDRLYLPEPGYIVKDNFYAFHNGFLSCRDPAPLVQGRKIYLSRRTFGGESCLENEAELEEALRKEGFLIYYPEEHSVAEQIAFISSAETVLALEGSALHTLLLVKGLQSSIIIIPRPKTEPNGNYATIATRKDFRQSYLPADGLYTHYSGVSQSHVQYRGTLDIDRLIFCLKGKGTSPYAIYSHCLGDAHRAQSNPTVNDEAMQKLQKENSELKACISDILKENKSLRILLNQTK